MTETDFARGLAQEVVQGNTAIYRELFSTTAPGAATDPYWQRAAGLFSSLGEEQRGVFLAVLRQVTIDAVSSTLAVLDGVAPLPEQQSEFELRHGAEVLSGALQDHFLAEVETL